MVFLMSDPQLAMRGPAGPSGMRGRSGSIVSSFRKHTHTSDLITLTSSDFTFHEKLIRWLVLLPAKALTPNVYAFLNTHPNMHEPSCCPPSLSVCGLWPELIIKDKHKLLWQLIDELDNGKNMCDLFYHILRRSSRNIYAQDISNFLMPNMILFLFLYYTWILYRTLAWIKIGDTLPLHHSVLKWIHLLHTGAAILHWWLDFRPILLNLYTCF